MVLVISGRCLRRSAHCRLITVSRHGDNLQVALDLVEIPLSFNFSQDETMGERRGKVKRKVKT